MAEKKTTTRLAGEEGPSVKQPTTCFRVATRDGRPTKVNRRTWAETASAALDENKSFRVSQCFMREANMLAWL
jgi:hypothetical protein